MILKRSFKWCFVLIIALYITACSNDSDNENSGRMPTTTDATKLDKDETFDVVTWNLEWFGAPQKSHDANTFNQQLNAVSKEIIALDADIYALQEVVIDYVNGNNFQKLIDKLNSIQKDTWAGIYSDRFSFYFNPNFYDFPAQRLCYIYRKNTVKVVKHEAMFKSIYNGSDTYGIKAYTGKPTTFWSSGRLPYRLTADIVINGSKLQVDLINIHAKCCGGSSGRRTADAQYLKHRLDNDYEGLNVIILGDYNDYYNRSMDGGESPYQCFYDNKNEKFKHIFGSGIDHISISDELYDEYEILQNDTSKMYNSISDHNPHMLRLWIK